MVPESNSRASQAICLFSLCHCLSKSVKFNVESFMHPHANSSVLQDLKGFYKRNSKVYDLLVGFLWLLGKLGFHSCFATQRWTFNCFFFFCFLHNRTETSSHAQPQKEHYYANTARQERLDCSFSKDQEKRREIYAASYSGSLYIHTTGCKWWHIYSY